MVHHEAGRRQALMGHWQRLREDKALIYYQVLGGRGFMFFFFFWQDPRGQSFIIYRQVGQSFMSNGRLWEHKASVGARFHGSLAGL